MSEASLYDMTDEELLNMDPTLFEERAAAEESGEEPQAEAPTLEAVADEDSDDADVEEEAVAEGSAETEEEVEVEAASENEEEEEQPEADEAAGEASAAEDADEAPAEEAVVEDAPDYKALYEELLAPFKANGKEMRVDSVADAKTLMQMGANYNKKMEALKPNLKLMKMLENNDLLDAAKLGFLIDLDKKDPGAIRKLVKESGIDLLEAEEDTSEYQPRNHTVSDKEIDLDAVLDKIQDTPTYQQTISVVGSKWDGASKQAIADTPQLLEVINDHMASGVYEVISTEVERQRAFGRLQGVTDLEAYRLTGEQLHNSGGFSHLNLAGSKETPAPSRREVTPEPKAEDSKLNEKRRAASSPKAVPPKKADKPADFNPLAMSDEEFEKQTNPRLM